MKHLTFVFLLIGAVMIFFGCNQESPIAPELNQSDEAILHELKQSDQVPASLERWVRTPFTGTSNFVQNIDSGTVTVLPNGKILTKGAIAEWYDSATDPRVTGQTIWYINSLIDPDGTGKMWGTAKLTFDDGLGKWKMYWWAKLTTEGVVAKAVGIGKKGQVKGLFAKWTYTMDFATGFFYTSKGCIFER